METVQKLISKVIVTVLLVLFVVSGTIGVSANDENASLLVEGLVLDSNTGMKLELGGVLEANTEYTMTVKLKYAATENGGGLIACQAYKTDSAWAGTFGVFQNETGAQDWTVVSQTFTTDASVSGAYFTADVYNMIGYIYIDELEIQKEGTTVYSEDFEDWDEFTVTTNGETVPDGWSFKAYGGGGKASLYGKTAPFVKDDNLAISVFADNDGSNIQPYLALGNYLENNETYTISMAVKTDILDTNSGGGGAFIQVLSSPGGSYLATITDKYEACSEDWTLFNKTFATGDDASNVCLTITLWHVIGEFLVDDIVIKKGETEVFSEDFEDWDAFEAKENQEDIGNGWTCVGYETLGVVSLYGKTYKEDNVSLQIDAESEVSNAQAVLNFKNAGLQANKDYTITFKARYNVTQVNSGGGGLTGIISGCGSNITVLECYTTEAKEWAVYKANFTTPATLEGSENMTIALWHVKGQFLIDDVQVFLKGTFMEMYVEDFEEWDAFELTESTELENGWSLAAYEDGGVFKLYGKAVDVPDEEIPDEKIPDTYAGGINALCFVAISSFIGVLVNRKKSRG